MKGSFYVYNNEAISSLVIISVLKRTVKMDIANLFLLLPCLLNDQFVKYLSNNELNELTLSSIVTQQIKLFYNFHQRYIELMPITLNSLMILQQSNLLFLKNDVVLFNNAAGKLFIPMNISKRYDKISEVTPQFIRLIAPYTSADLYTLLKIRL